MHAVLPPLILGMLLCAYSGRTLIPRQVVSPVVKEPSTEPLRASSSTTCKHAQTVEILFVRWIKIRYRLTTNPVIGVDTT